MKMNILYLRFVLMFLLCGAQLFGQTVDENQKMRAYLNGMFQHLDRNSVPTGFLRDYAVEYENLDLFTGEVPLNDNNIGNLVRFGRLNNSIMGPKVGYSGAQYILSNPNGSIAWTSSNTNIATINSNGILTAIGRGVTTLTAYNNGNTYSQVILVGMPRYILSASFKPGGYEINAECIDAQYDNHLSQLNGVLTYKWGVKYPNKVIRWVETETPNLMVQLEGQNEQVVVYLQITNANGDQSVLQHIQINSQDVYVAQNQNLIIDANGQMYKANGQQYSYSYARLFISYRENIPSKYLERVWMATTAMVLKPFSATSTIEARSGGPLIKDILSTSDLDYIKNNSVDNEVYRYTVMLLNYKSMAIQFVPVTFTYKTNM